MKLVSQRLVALVCCLLMATANVPTSIAQQQDSKSSPDKSAGQKKEATKQKQSATTSRYQQKRSKRTVAKTLRAKITNLTSQIPNSISLVNETREPEFLMGQARVIVKGNQDPIIRLGIARNGSTVVEFPASDHFFAIHPGGGSNIVTVDESPTLATDHFLVFRAGKDFIAPSPNSKKSVRTQATVSVQMESGMFVTLMFYSVSSVSQMAHRLVVIYSRDEVVAARRKAGLAVNLNERDSQESVNENSSKGVNENASAKTAAPINTNTSEVENQQIGEGANDESADIVQKTRQALQSALSSPMKFTLWSKPLHGLSVSSLAPVNVSNHHSLAIIAVKNTTSKTLRLIDGQPDIDVLTLNDKGQVVLIQTLTKLHVETSSVDGTIPANSIAYFALLFEPPVLSANQRVRVSAANRDAADEPATAFLSK